MVTVKYVGKYVLDSKAWIISHPAEYKIYDSSSGELRGLGEGRGTAVSNLSSNFALSFSSIFLIALQH
jgi:hypothetical protein